MINTIELKYISTINFIIPKISYVHPKRIQQKLFTPKNHFEKIQTSLNVTKHALQKEASKEMV